MFGGAHARPRRPRMRARASRALGIVPRLTRGARVIQLAGPHAARPPSISYSVTGGGYTSRTYSSTFWLGSRVRTAQ